MKILRFICFIFCVSLISLNTNAQEDQNSPSVILNDGNIECNNFPGISKGGQFIIYVHSDYSCCIETEVTVRLYSQKSRSVIEEFLIYPNEVDDYYFSEKEFEYKSKELNKLLKQHNFKCMPTLNDFEIKEEKDHSIFIFEKFGKKYNSSAFKLPEYSASDHCCAYMNGDDPCMLQTKVHSVWKDLKSNYLFVSYGVIHPADGCDIGPFYMLLELNDIP